MKHLVLSVCAGLIFCFSAYTQTTETVESYNDIKKILTFNATLTDVLSSGDLSAPGNSYYVLKLSVRTVKIFDSNPETFRAEAQCIDAWWETRNKLASRAAILRFSGSEFAERVSSLGTDTPGTVSPNRQCLVLVQVAGKEMKGDEVVPILNVVDIKAN